MMRGDNKCFVLALDLMICLAVDLTSVERSVLNITNGHRCIGQKILMSCQNIMRTISAFIVLETIQTNSCSSVTLD
jgi:hypothetical protein